MKVTDTYKRLSYQAYVRDDTNRIKNDKSIGNPVGDVVGGGDGNTNYDAKLYKEEGAGTYTVVTAVSTTDEAVSREEVCVPPVPVAKSNKLDAGDLPLSSCASKKHVCINTNNKEKCNTSSSFQQETGVCYDIWVLPEMYMDRGSPRNEAAPNTSTYWEDTSSTGSAASYFLYMEDTVALYKEHSLDDEAGNYVDTSTTIVHHSFYEDGDMYKHDHGDRPYATDRHLEERDARCDGICGTDENNCPLVNVDGVEFRNVITSCYDTPSCQYNRIINCWDVSKVTDMTRAFFFNTIFNEPLECWDTGSVTNMNDMFLGASSFNQPVDTWDVSQVGDMKSMFRSASSFNQPVDTWDVSQVTTMYLMLYSASR